jgi:hypothetical protein
MASTQESYPDGTYLDHSDPAYRWANIVPSDATVYSTKDFRAIWVSIPVSSPTAVITLVDHADVQLAFTMQPGFFGVLPLKPKKIMATGTTAGIELRRLF